MSCPALAKASTKLEVVTEQWRPFNYTDENGNIVGVSTQVVKKVLSHANIDYTLSINTWDKSYHLARTQANVLIYSIFRTPIREKLFHWICPVTPPLTQSIYRLSTRNDIIVNNEQDLKKYSISVTRGTFPHQLFESKGLKEGINLQLTADNYINAQMLFKQRVDLIVEAEAAIKYILEQNGFKKEDVTKVYSYVDETTAQNCMALSLSTSQEIVEQIRASHIAVTGGKAF